MGAEEGRLGAFYTLYSLGGLPPPSTLKSEEIQSKEKFPAQNLDPGGGEGGGVGWLVDPHWPRKNYFTMDFKVLLPSSSARYHVAGSRL